MTRQLVADEEAELARRGVEQARVNPYRTAATTFLMVPVEDWLERLLDTRAALIAALEWFCVAAESEGCSVAKNQTPGCPVGLRLRENRALLAGLHGNREQAASLFTDRDSTSGTSAPPETEKG